MAMTELKDLPLHHAGYPSVAPGLPSAIRRKPQRGKAGDARRNAAGVYGSITSEK